MITCDHCGTTEKPRRYYFFAKLVRYGFWRGIFSCDKEMNSVFEYRDLCKHCVDNLQENIQTAFLSKLRGDK